MSGQYQSFLNVLAPVIVVAGVVVVSITAYTTKPEPPSESEAAIAVQVEPYLVFGSQPRSPQWRAVRDKFLTSHPQCCVCDHIAEVVHHIKPFHLYPDLELDEDNLLPFCDRCHLLVGHLGNFQNYNPDVVEHAGMLHNAKLKADEARMASKTEMAP